ncbi:hypothetical protein IWW34DRAFT_811677 [Fusarium oxysporum f. sp. albedinis]|nr:hypothetical protein IWW34DRAFT_811677 [Fusarium oxysporum f. sp. albedinis]
MALPCHIVEPLASTILQLQGWLWSALIDFPILSLDQDLVYIYWQRYRNSSFTEEMNDEGLLQLPYATSLYITRSTCKPLFILELEGNGLDDIRCLKKWMADTYKAILCRKPSTHLIRALLLAVLCFQREGEFAQASKAFEFLELDKLGFDPPLLNTCDLRTATQAFLSGL